MTLLFSIALLALRCSTSCAFWVKLKQHLLQQFATHCSLHHCQLHTATKGNQSFIDYLARVSAIAEELTAIGGHLDNEDLILFTANGLLVDFEAFIITIENLPSPLSFTDLCAKLLVHE